MHDQPLMDTGEVRRSLAELVKAYQDGDWRIPGFQREFIWPRYKIRNWAQTILDERRIRLGVIVTYQLLSEKQAGFPVYIADGRQRLEATIRFLENPRRYGFALTPEQAWTFSNSYYVVVQHNHFESHDEGLWAFQALNLGTTVAPAEFYKGELTRFPNGLYLWQTIPSIVDKVSHHLCTKPATNKHRAVLQRDSLALFYQYASGTDEMDFWNVATSLIRPGNEERVVERVLASFSNGRTRDELEQLIKSFQRFLEGTTALVGQLLHETGYAEGTAMSPSMLRWMMHTAIWRKNTSGPVGYEHEVPLAPEPVPILPEPPLYLQRQMLPQLPLGYCSHIFGIQSVFEYHFHQGSPRLGFWSHQNFNGVDPFFNYLSPFCDSLRLRFNQ